MDKRLPVFFSACSWKQHLDQHVLGSNSNCTKCLHNHAVLKPSHQIHHGQAGNWFLVEDVEPDYTHVLLSFIILLCMNLQVHMMKSIAFSWMCSYFPILKCTSERNKLNYFWKQSAHTQLNPVPTHVWFGKQTSLLRLVWFSTNKSEIELNSCKVCTTTRHSKN